MIVMTITYRNFIGLVEDSPEGAPYVGYVQDIPEQVTFSGQDSMEIIDAFEACIDTYLTTHPRQPVFTNLPGVPVTISPAIPPAHVRLNVEKYSACGWDLEAITRKLNREYRTRYTPEQIQEIYLTKK